MIIGVPDGFDIYLTFCTRNLILWQFYSNSMTNLMTIILKVFGNYNGWAIIREWTYTAMKIFQDFSSLMELSTLIYY